MEQIYYGVALCVYSLFIIRFILSWVGGDFELDADADLDISDLVSFKGLTHFLMGASGWLSVKAYTTHNIMWYDYLIAFILGVIFVIILYFVYKFLMKLESKPETPTGKGLIGRPAKVYLPIEAKDVDGLFKCIVTIDNGIGTFEAPAKSKNPHEIGDAVIVSDYVNAYYII